MPVISHRTLKEKPLPEQKTMKQVVVNIKDDKYRFFMELVKNLDFVKVQEETGDSKKEVTANLTQGLKDLERHKQGKLKTTPAKSFLDEL